MEQPHEELSRRLDGFDATLKELTRDLKLLVTLQMKMNEKCPKDDPKPKLDGDMVMSGCDQEPANAMNKKRKLQLHDIINGSNYQKHQVTLNEVNNEMELKKGPHTDFEEMKNEEGPVAIISSSATQSDSKDFINKTSYPIQLISSLSRLQTALESPPSFYINAMEKIRKLRTGIFPMEDVFVDQDDDEDTPMVTRDVENVMRRYESFKKFDTVVDHSDHLLLKYISRVKQRSKDWEENLKKEWKDLEKNLPEGIYVRAYKGRMDILRAVIVGPQGTPYHDGLFFFDVGFPSSYPISHPLVQYHSGGLFINPNMYASGNVSLALCKKTGDEREDEEMWVPGSSTMLQFLVFLQKLLNEKPLFNRSIYMNRSILQNEVSSIIYNENILVKSLKTMVYIMHKPPRNFEDLVVGHFRQRACDILKAYKAYKEGLQVGCDVNGIQADCKGTSSITFMSDLASCFNPLVAAFNKIGAEVPDEFRTLF